MAHALNSVAPADVEKMFRQHGPSHSRTPNHHGAEARMLGNQLVKFGGAEPGHDRLGAGDHENVRGLQDRRPQIGDLPPQKKVQSLPATRRVQAVLDHTSAHDDEGLAAVLPRRHQFSAFRDGFPAALQGLQRADFIFAENNEPTHGGRNDA